MSVHAPGPWLVEFGERGLDCQIRDAEGESVTCFNFNCDVGPYSPETEKANAFLTAAAPELLEALREVRAYLPSLYQQAHGRAWPVNSAIRKQLDKAIAKAEGGK